MKKYLLLCTVFFVSTCFQSPAQIKKNNPESPAFFIAKGKRMQADIQLSGDQLTVNMICDPANKTKTPCVTAFGTLPPPIPKCNPKTCLNKMWFIRESTGMYRLKFTLENDPKTTYTLSSVKISDSFKKGLVGTNFNRERMSH